MSIGLDLRILACRLSVRRYGLGVLLILRFFECVVVSANEANERLERRSYQSFLRLLRLWVCPLFVLC